MNDKIKTEIKTTIETSIEKFFKDKKVEVTHVLDILFPVERRIRSLIGGLETSFGTTVWEPVAKTLAKNNGFEVLDNKKFMMPDKIPVEVQTVMAKWEALRSNRDNNVSLMDYIIEIRDTITKLGIKSGSISGKKITAGKGIDLWLKKNSIEYIFDIKTNQINQNGGLSLNKNLMDWYTYRLLLDPSVNIICKIAFPFNPFGEKGWWSAQGSRVYPLQPKIDAVVENEFWNFLSGEENTWEEIFYLFKELGEENFGKKFKNIFYSY